FAGIQLMLNSPVWSLSLEIMFYLIVPFVFRWRRTTVAMLWITLVLTRCAFLTLYPTVGEAWNRNFFPFELPFFLLGSCSYKMHRSGLAERFSPWAIRAVSCAFVMLLLFYQYLTKVEWFIYPLAVISLPFVFYLSKDSHLDRKIGNLSYPVYLVHFLAITLIGPVLWYIDYRVYCEYVSIGVLAASTLLAILLDRFVAEPVEKLRRRLAV
ncbi:MAG: acyltransferase, partial [Planctomycetes bacterium]|nr:acyltransferase [Planctomycetota bacterium]